jgi:hypothetical protein
VIIGQITDRRGCEYIVVGFTSTYALVLTATKVVHSFPAQWLGGQYPAFYSYAKSYAKFNRNCDFDSYHSTVIVILIVIIQPQSQL